MFIGHYGLALASKRADPRVSLGVLIAAAQLADMIWPGLLAVLYFGIAYGPPPPSVSTVAWGTLGSWLIPIYGWWIDRHRAAA
jgi:hypothetical protein